MDVVEAIKNRRSIRQFIPEDVPSDVIEKILDCGRFAPTAGNNQPWKFLILKKKNNKVALKKEICNYFKNIDEHPEKITRK